MHPPLAAVPALIDRLARLLTAAEEVRAAALLDDVSTEVRAVTGRTWTRPDGELDPARPGVLAVVTLRAAERAMRNPDGLSGETVGQYTRRFGDTTGGAGSYLTDAERRMLTAATGGGAALVSVPTVRDTGPGAVLWKTTVDGGDAIPWEVIE
jgi:hypothetical protein